MVSRESLLMIKRDVDGYIGQEVSIKTNIGRKKGITKKCVIDSTYSSHFLVKEEGTFNKATYTYADIVTNSLQISNASGELISDYDFSTPKFMRL